MCLPIDKNCTESSSKFSNETKRGTSVVTAQDRLSLQQELKKIAKRLDKWEMPLNVNKWQVLHASKKNKIATIAIYIYVLRQHKT